MISVDLMSLWTFVCSVLLCSSVRNRKHPLDEKMSMRFAGEFFLSRRIFLSLTEHTDLTEPFCALFRTHEEVAPPPTPPRREGRNMWGYPYKTASKGHNEAYVLFIGVSRWSLPFPLGEGPGEGLLFLWAFVCSVLLCKSVRNRTHPLYEMTHKQLAGEVFFSQNSQI